LIEILPQWKPLPISISALYPPNRHVAAKVRVFVEWIAAVFENCPAMRVVEVARRQSFDISTFNDVASSL
jgi:LysR family transcriptional regulator for bpeEF and oprC